MLLEVFLLKINIVKKLPIIIIVIIIIVKRNGWQLHIGLLLFYLCIGFIIFLCIVPWYMLGGYQWSGMFPDVLV